MSKWLKKDKFEEFATKKQNEAENESNVGGGFALKWKNPEMGTVERAKEYVIRFLPDKNSNFYEKYFYHGFTSGDKFQYIFCEKTFGMDKYCPWCEANKILYQGNDADKQAAFNYKRKERFVGNIKVIDDPRDADVQDDDKKVSGTVRLYEFPGVVESKVKNEITDRRNGYGIQIFDPEEGYDFILKVKAKPKDKNGKEWPDYGDSMFSRRPSSVGDSEEEIKEIMDKTYDLKEYLEKMRMSLDDQEKLLKSEMLWDDVSANFNKYLRGQEVKNTVDTSELDNKKESSVKNEETSNTEENEVQNKESNSSESESNEPENAEDLLKELEGM
jgi:hypothetical protein